MKCLAIFFLLVGFSARGGAQPLQAHAGNDTAVCPAPGSSSGETQPRIGMPATGGVPPYTYVWSLNGSVAPYLLDSPMLAQPRVVQNPLNLDSAFFVVQVTDAVSAVARDTVKVYFSRWVYTMGQCIQFKNPADTVSISGQGTSINFGPLHSPQWTPALHILDAYSFNSRSYTPVTQNYVLHATDRAGCRALAGSCSVVVSSTHVPKITAPGNTVRVTPSPATPDSRIEISTDLLGGELRIFSVNGRLVRSLTLRSISTPLAEAAISAGYYFYRIVRAAAPDLAGRLVVVE